MGRSIRDKSHLHYRRQFRAPLAHPQQHHLHNVCGKVCFKLSTACSSGCGLHVLPRLDIINRGAIAVPKCNCKYFCIERTKNLTPRPRQQTFAPESSQQPPASNSLQAQQAPLPSGPSPLPQQLQQYTMNLANASSQPGSSQSQPQFPPGVKVPQTEQAGPSSLAPSQQQPSAIGGQRPSSTTQQQTQQRSTPTAFPGSLSDLVVSFENVKQKGTLPAFYATEPT